MAISDKQTNDERPPERLSVAMSPAFYRALVQIIEANETQISVEKVLELLESHLGDTIARTVAEVTGMATPFPQGVEVDLQIAEREDDIDDDDDDVRESLKQGLRDSLRGDVLTEAEFWKAVADDE